VDWLKDINLFAKDSVHFQFNLKEPKPLLSLVIKPYARNGNSMLMLFAYGTIYLMLLKPSEARHSLSLKYKSLLVALG